MSLREVEFHQSDCVAIIDHTPKVETILALGKMMDEGLHGYLTDIQRLRLSPSLSAPFPAFVRSRFASSPVWRWRS